VPAQAQALVPEPARVLAQGLQGLTLMQVLAQGLPGLTLTLMQVPGLTQVLVLTLGRRLQ